MAENIKEIMELLFGSTDELNEEMVEYVTQMISIAKEIAKRNEENFGNIIGRGFVKGIDVLKSELNNLNIMGVLGSFSEEAGNELKKSFENMGKALEDSGALSFLASVGVNERDLEGVKDVISTVVNEDNVIRFSAQFAFSELVEGFNKISRPVSDVEKEVLNFTQSAEKATRGLVSPLENLGNNAVTQGISSYREQVSNLVQEFGIAQEEAETFYQGLSKAGVNIRQLSALEATAGDTAETFKGLEAAFFISRATGLELGEVAKQLNVQTRTLGVSTEDAQDAFEIFSRVQANTTLKIKDVADAIGSAQEKMKFFGDTTEGSSMIFKGLLDTFDDGREALARPLFERVIDGLGGMSMGVRSFIGMTNNIGGGGRGPIGAGLAVEEAFATGEGLEEVLEGVRNQIEQFSGAQIMTRSEALETGQEQQFEIQRQLLQQFLGVQDSQQQNLVLEFLQNSDFGAIRETIGSTGQGLMAGEVRQRAATEVGGSQQAIANRLEAISNIEASSALADSLIEGTKQINLAGDSFKKGADAVEESLEAGAEAFRKVLSDMGMDRQEGVIQGAAEEAEAARRGEIDTTQVQAAQVNALPEAAARGFVYDEQLRSLANSVGTTAEQLNTFSESAVTTAEQLNQLSEIRKRYIEIETDRISVIERLRDIQAKNRESLAGMGDAAESSTTTKKEIVEREVKIKVTAEMDESGNINFVPVVSEIAEDTARRIVEEQAGAPTE